MNVTVIGAGLAGSEAAWQLAQRGIDVTLREMKPEKKTPAHETEYFAELCCSNSLRSDQLENAVGLLKEELRRLGSLILQCADATRVEAGGALAVDRYGFARMVTEQVRSHPRITVVPGEVTEIPEGEVVIASGPLTSDALAERLQALLGADTALHFYDAAAPLVTAESVDPAVASVSHVNVNEGSVEGLKYVRPNCFTVQFHPEASPGPMDTEYLFDRFVDSMKGGDR